MSHPTRQALIEAGLDLTSVASLNRLTIDAIVQKAGVAKGTFYVHFADRTAYLVALHAYFHEQLRDTIFQAIATLPPGGKRLQLGSITYLDACLRARAVKAILLEARCEAPIAAEVQRRNAEFVLDAHADFAAMSWPDPANSARFYVAMVAEAALVELETDANEALRHALWHFARLDVQEEMQIKEKTNP